MPDCAVLDTVIVCKDDGEERDEISCIQGT